VAAWAFVLGILLILLAAGSSEGETGGADTPPVIGQAPAGKPAPELGQRILSRGAVGEDVRTLQQILGAKDYGPLVPHGTFDEPTEQSVKRFQRAAGLAVDGIVGPQTRPALVALMRVLKATWYGPGFYGRRTACGKRLGRATLGVAHRTLPCGTRVTFYHGGRFATVAVIDRGPFRQGVAWDLTEAAAKRLGFRSTGALRSVH
jgi:peptidoglycan hydrolase-like protein with peptidoglycan-binding domain